MDFFNTFINTHTTFVSFFPTFGVFLFVLVLSSLIFEFADTVLVMGASILFMLISGMISPEQILEMIDWKTILLLFGMMIVVEVTRESKLISLVSLKIIKFTKGNPMLLIIMFGFSTLILSTFLANATTMLVLVPITIALTKGMGVNPKPFLFTEIIFSDIGGALTLVGDPTNVMIGTANNFSFFDFLQHQTIPVIAVSFAFIVVLLIVYWETVKPIGRDLLKLLMNTLLMEKIKKNFLSTTISPIFIFRCSIVLSIILLFFVFNIGNLSLPVIALLGAVSILFLNKKFVKLTPIFKNVDWHLLFFFAGLFIHVGVLEYLGVLHPISAFISSHAHTTLEFSLYILWIIGLLSGFVENIPLVAMMIPVIQGVLAHGGLEGNTEMVWYALSLGACFGGNGSLIGSSANMIVAKIAEKEDIKISFFEYFKIGYPLTILALIISSIFLYFTA